MEFCDQVSAADTQPAHPWGRASYVLGRGLLPNWRIHIDRPNGDQHAYDAIHEAVGPAILTEVVSGDELRGPLIITTWT